MPQITVTVDDQRGLVATYLFEGRILAENLETNEDDFPAGTRHFLAQMADGRFAAWAGRVSGPFWFRDFDSLQEMVGCVPEDLVTAALLEIGED